MQNKRLEKLEKIALGNLEKQKLLKTSVKENHDKSKNTNNGTKESVIKNSDKKENKSIESKKKENAKNSTGKKISAFFSKLRDNLRNRN